MKQDSLDNAVQAATDSADSKKTKPIPLSPRKISWRYLLLFALALPITQISRQYSPDNKLTSALEQETLEIVDQRGYIGKNAKYTFFSSPAGGESPVDRVRITQCKDDHADDKPGCIKHKLDAGETVCFLSNHCYKFSHVAPSSGPGNVAVFTATKPPHRFEPGVVRFY